ncbi:MAG: serine hydrolase, partial [Patescibacteria group bacterium]
MIGTLVGALAAFAIASPAEARFAIEASLPYSQTMPAIVRNPPQKRRRESVGVKTSARSAFVADIASGEVLYAKDPHRVQSIASLTKLVTAMLFLDQKPDLSRTVTIEDADEDAESKVVLASGEVFTQGDLLKAMLVGSVNAAANALARTSIGTEKFVERMNAKMANLNLRSPRFIDPSGLDDGNRANAADVAAILSTALTYPEIRDATKLAEVTVVDQLTRKKIKLKSTNLLLSSFLNQKPFGIIAAKTGSLPSAGYCMAQVTKRADGHQIVAVELGS